MKNLWGAFKAGVIVFYVYTFIKWYINMHFHKKWGWLFWLNTICAICLYFQMNDDNYWVDRGWTPGNQGTEYKNFK